MVRTFSGLLVITFWTFCTVCLFALSNPGKEFDFDFKDLEVCKAIESIARMEDRNVIFGSTVKNDLITFHLKKVTPEVALKIILDTYGLTANLKNGVLFINPAVERKLSSSSTVVIPLVNVVARDIEVNIKPFIPTGGSYGYSINEQRNAFIINAPDDAILQVRKLIEELDQEITQIFIEAKIIDTTSNFVRQLGIEWGNKLLRSGAGASSSSGAVGSAAAGASVPAISSAGNTGAGVNVSGFAKESPLLIGLSTAITSKAQLDARITAAENNGDAKTISSPKITTLNGTPATIISATTITFKTLVNTGSGAQSAGGSQNLKAGLQFTVTPFIVSEDQVRLNLNISKSEPGAMGPDSIPTISESSATTSLIVRNGETASIGGLVSQSTLSNSFGVPFLSSIPILGGLFGSLYKSRDNHELIIFMTPTIFRSSREVSGLRRRNYENEAWEQKETVREALDALHKGGSMTEPNRGTGLLTVTPETAREDVSEKLSGRAVDTLDEKASAKFNDKPADAETKLKDGIAVPAAPAVTTAPVERLFQKIESQSSSNTRNAKH